MVDSLLVQRKLSELDTYLKQIKEYQDIRLSDYKAQWKVQRIVERTLHLMIEVCIDIANHIISDRGFRPPTSYADTFVILMEAGLINKSLCKRFQKMAKFRNIVVHNYVLHPICQDIFMPQSCRGHATSFSASLA